MEKAIANQTYGVLALDDDLFVIDSDEDSDTWIDQIKGDELELWKTRDDGYHFVYCNRIMIGYWVSPELISLIDKR